MAKHEAPDARRIASLEETVDQLRQQVAQMVEWVEITRPLLVHFLQGSGASSRHIEDPLIAQWVPKFARLTKKMQAYVFATMAGHTYSEIAEVSGVSESTVKLSMRAALEKLGLSSKNDLDSNKHQILREIEERGGAESLFHIPINWASKKPKHVIELLGRTREGPPPPPRLTRSQEVKALVTPARPAKKKVGAK